VPRRPEALTIDQFVLAYAYVPPNSRAPHPCGASTTVPDDIANEPFDHVKIVLPPK
jgi:hypothetical protein